MVKVAQAILRHASISPKKLNPFAKMLRHSHVDDALIQCQISPKKAAKLCYQVLRSAIANATVKGMEESKLLVEEAFVGKAKFLKRMRIHGKGRSGVMHKMRAHLTIVVREGNVRRKTKVVPPYLQRVRKHALPKAAAAAVSVSSAQ